MIIYDFEVFKHDTLLGALNEETGEIQQIWSIAGIKEYAKENLNNIWVGYNCDHYDKILLHRDSVWEINYYRQGLCM